MQLYVRDMRIANYSERTISARVELIDRFRAHLAGTPLLEATPEQIREFQERFLHLSASSANVYARHLRALYLWAGRRRMVDPLIAEEIIVPRVPQGRPHPTKLDDLRTIFACATGGLRMAYTLAAFAGLRCGEVCRLEGQDIDRDGRLTTALVNGKGGKQRTVPLLAPVVDEMAAQRAPRSGPVIRRQGRGYRPEQLSLESHYFLAELGIPTTLHSMRGTYATHVGHITRDPMFVRDLLGHGSVSTSEVYMETSLRDAHVRLAGVATLAEDVLSYAPHRAGIRAVGQ